MSSKNILITICVFRAAISFAQQPDNILNDHEIRMYESGVEYHFYSDVPYLGTQRKEQLDIYAPVSTISKLRPAVVLIHGGGWGLGDKQDARVKQAAEFFVTKGYVAVGIDYMLTTYEADVFKSPKVKGAWPQNIYDCKTAVRFIKKYADKLNIDKDRVIVMGFSAGGHLALLTGLSSESKELNSGGLYTGQSNDVYRIIDFYGIPDVRKWGGKAFIDVSQQDRPEVWAMASPVEYVSKDSPAILIVHGTKDPTVDISLSEEFVEILKAKKVKHRFVRVEGGVHGFNLAPTQMDLRSVIDEFLEHEFNE